MAKILPFMELDGFKKLKECETQLIMQRVHIERLEELLASEVQLRKVYEGVAETRLQKIIELERGMLNDQEENTEAASSDQPKITKRNKKQVQV